MKLDDLEKLHAAVEFLLRKKSFLDSMERLSVELSYSREPFVWSTVALNQIERELPAVIKSCWIFVLRKDTPSGCHYHPNSIQHMVTIKGQGRGKVADTYKRMVPFDSSDHSVADKWYVIGKRVSHEFFPECEDMTVVSFHTCEAGELEEVACDTGERRLYESPER